jgi:DNA adenine methylase
MSLSSIDITKPCIKWVGGKTQILDKLLPLFPREISNYHEPFLGGGSVLLALLSHVKAGSIVVKGHIYANDLNEPLIHLYKNIQSRHLELYNKIKEYVDEFRLCASNNALVNRKPSNIDEARSSKESYYYWIRSQYNKLSKDEKNSIIGSAMLLFMNKTGFRGVFRVGPNGYNVPYGHYTNPEIVNLEHLTEIHDLIQGVVFETADFSTSLAHVSLGDFVYLDPPYAPETAKSFVGYNESGFDLQQHKKLFTLCNDVTSRGQMIMSNSDVELVRESFNPDKYTICPILCKRSINSTNPSAKAKEVIITYLPR